MRNFSKKNHTMTFPFAAWKRIEIRPVRCHRTHESIRGERPFHRSRRRCRRSVKNTGLKYLFYRLDRGVVGRNTFSVSVSGAACRPGSHETTPPPIHPRPPRNANSAIEFSGILPDDQTDAVELNFAATPCRYTRALPSPPISTHVSFQRRASLIPLSASLDIFHWTRGGELAANP